jgi:hypothetical protein
MVIEGNSKELVVNLYTDEHGTEKGKVVYRVSSLNRSVAEDIICLYKEVFGHRHKAGILPSGSFATLSWVENDENFICDSWDSVVR